MRTTLPIAAIGLLVTVGLAVEPLSASLVLRLNFDDSTATDLSGNNNHGVVGSNVFYTADTPFGGGLAGGTGTGGGATRVVTVPTSSTLEAIDDQFTLSFWMKATTASNNNWVRIFQHGTEANPSQTWLVARYSDTADVNVRVDTLAEFGGKNNQNIAVAGTPTFDDTWHHVFYTIDNGTYREYVDGRLSTSGTYLHGDGLSNTRPLCIFGRSSGEYVGLLDDIALWDDAKGPSWPATITAFADWFGLSLDDPGVAGVASLTAHGQIASAGGIDWTFTTQFPTDRTGDPLVAGKHYFGDDGLRYIIFASDGQGGWVGVEQTPEPGTLVLLALGAVGLGLARRRARRMQ